jgi:predicted alpha/beta-hydrolase family hydrolase
MTTWAERLGELGDVTTFDYPYMSAGKKRPDRMPVLLESHRAAIANAHGRAPLVLAGKSMGARVGCHVAAQDDEIGRGVAAVVCFGYPLRGQSGKLRDEVLLELRAPILFLQGTRDALCPLELLEQVRPRMRAQSVLEVVEGGDHSLQVTKTKLAQAKETQADVDGRILRAVRGFLEGALAHA